MPQTMAPIVVCPKCGTKNRVDLSRAAARQPVCGRCKMPLPADHVRVLARSNGIEGYAGYLRLFAVGGDAAIELRSWNTWGLWKAAWGGRAP